MLSIIVMRFSPEESGTGSANAFMTEKDACALETMMERALPTHAGKIHPIPRGRVIGITQSSFLTNSASTALLIACALLSRKAERERGPMSAVAEYHLPGLIALPFKSVVPSGKSKPKTLTVMAKRSSDTWARG
jgi:hypothetical protein